MERIIAAYRCHQITDGELLSLVALERRIDENFDSFVCTGCSRSWGELRQAADGDGQLRMVDCCANCAEMKNGHLVWPGRIAEAADLLRSRSRAQIMRRFGVTEATARDGKAAILKRAVEFA
jgi:hypothetical protein